MTTLVTGGAGFIGSNYISLMLSAHPEDRIVCVDKLTYAGRRENMADFLHNPRFRFVQADICDRTAMESLFAQEHFDAVINFAAETHVDRSIGDPAVFLRTNILGTQVLLDACRTHAVPRYHQISTDEVYGDLPLDRPDLLFTEESAIRTSSPYSAAKAGADLLVLAYHRTYGLHATISRCSNNYGPRQHPEKLIPLMIARCLRGEPLPVYGEGLNVRDWIHVDDHCRAVDLILRQGRPGEVYNVGSRCERRNIDLVRMICRELHCPEALITHVRDREGHDLRYAIDPAKIETQLGWKPAVTFEEGLAATIHWYRENPWALDA